jgi:hypothetical protein
VELDLMQIASMNGECRLVQMQIKITYKGEVMDATCSSTNV